MDKKQESSLNMNIILYFHLVICTFWYFLCTSLQPIACLILLTLQRYLSLSWRADKNLGITVRQLEQSRQIHPPELDTTFPCGVIPYGRYHGHPTMHGH